MKSYQQSGLAYICCSVTKAFLFYPYFSVSEEKLCILTLENGLKCYSKHIYRIKMIILDSNLPNLNDYLHTDALRCTSDCVHT